LAGKSRLFVQIENPTFGWNSLAEQEIEGVFLAATDGSYVGTLVGVCVGGSVGERFGNDELRADDGLIVGLGGRCVGIPVGAMLGVVLV